MKGWKVIDCDGHVDPGLLVDWERYAPPPYGEMMTQLAREQFSLMGHQSSLHRGAWDSTARLEDMGKEGIDVAVLFGGSTGGVQAGVREDPAYAVALCRAYNNWLAEYCGVAPERLKGAGALPFSSAEDVVKEARRVVTELGFVTVVVPTYLDLGKRLVSLYDDYFTPLYQEAENLNIPIAVHAPAPHFRKFLQQRYKAHFQVHAIDFPAALMMASMDVICSGLLERYRTLRFAFLEGAVGWVPWWIDRLDEHFEKLPHHVPRIARKPSEYFKDPRIVFSCESGEALLGQAVQVLGESQIIYASDYPHWDCEYPESVNKVLNRTDITETVKRKILSDNGARLYSLDSR